MVTPDPTADASVHLVAAATFGAEALHEGLRGPDHGHLNESIVDLRRVQFVSPGALAAVCAFVERMSEDGRHVRVLEPTDKRIGGYMSRMHLGQILDQLGASHTLSPVREHDRAEALLELRRFEPDHLSEWARLVYNAALRTAAKPVAGELWTGMVEAGQNVSDHSGRSAGYIAAQSTRKGLKFGVADAGMGFLEALRKRGAESSAEAIRLALAGVSDSDDEARGMGVQTMARNLPNVGGSLIIVSGDTRASVRRRSAFKAFDRPFPGATVEGTLPPTRQFATR